MAAAVQVAVAVQAAAAHRVALKAAKGRAAAEGLGAVVPLAQRVAAAAQTVPQPWAPVLPASVLGLAPVLVAPAAALLPRASVYNAG